MKKFFFKPVLCLMLCVLVSSFLFAGGQKESEEAVPETENTEILTVFTSILPQKYFVEKIGGDRVQVEVFVGPGKSPATYEPDPRQVELLGASEILFTIGVPFEKAFLPKIEGSLPNLKVVDTTEGVERRFLGGREGQDGTPGHGSGAKDPHVWLSARLVKKQAENIYTALVAADPEGKSAYSEGLEIFLKELDDVDALLAEALAPYEGKKFFVFHPAFGYFGDDYGLTQVAIETGGKEPAPSKLEEIIEQAKEQDVKIIFVQPEFSKSSAQAIAEAIDGSVVMLAPLSPDYINNLKSISDEVKKAFQ